MPDSKQPTEDDTFEQGERDYIESTQSIGWRQWAAKARLWHSPHKPIPFVHFRCSEVLFIECVQTALQRGWVEFALALLVERRQAHHEVSADIASRAVVAGESEETCQQLQRLLLSAQQILQNAPVAMGFTGVRATLDAADGPKNSDLRDHAEQLLENFNSVATVLPRALREAIDTALEQRHRRFMVLGKTSPTCTELWPPIPIQNQHVHAHALVGLALSGGGIRSASFSAGALEALARKGLLRAFDVVSSVSGGGYAAAWIGAWAYRHGEGLSGVEADLTPMDGLTRAPLRWLRRHCAYLAPRRGSTVSSDLWALITAYLMRWLPILLLVTAWLLALLLAPHAVVALSKWIARQSQALPSNWAVLGLGFAAIATVALLGLLRRLTMYHRVQAATPRSSPWLQQLVVFTTVGVSLLLAGCLSLLSGASAPLAPTLTSLELVTSVALGCTLALTLSVLLATLLARPRIQQALDRFRVRYLKHDLTSPGKLVRHSIPHSQRILATLCGIAVATLCLTILLHSSLQQNLKLHALFTVGPPAILASYGLAELASMAILAPHLLERDRAWAARVAGWMIAAVVATTMLFGLALWPDPIDLGQEFPQVLVGMALTTLVLAAVLWRIAGIAAVGNAALALLVLWLLSLGVVSPLVRWFPVDDGGGIVAATVGIVVFALILGRQLDVNRFTLHGIYKEGLVRTFLGASRLSMRHPRVRAPADMLPEERAQFEPRRADPATNIDEDDDLSLAWLQSRPDRPMPLFLFNAAVSGRSASDVDGRVPREWPFTFSPYYCGSPAGDIGYAGTREFFADTTNLGERLSISVGTAMAVSGAAMSPVSGRHTQPVTAFLKALLNARLGLWLGNPSDVRAVRSRSPSPGGTTLLREMLGVRTRFGRWLHLSDGGHFENLGLHELLRRGCRRIVVVDASCDHRNNLSDLAEAFRRARIDLGVHVHRTQRWAGDAGPDKWDRPWAWFEIDYGDDLPRGRLLYVKPSTNLKRPLPVEVLNYANDSVKFPHESTSDQFFTEPQMEAYRLLGRSCMEEALETALAVSEGSTATPDQDPGLVLLLRELWKGNSASKPNVVKSMSG